MAKHSDKSTSVSAPRFSFLERSSLAWLAILQFAGPLLFFTNLTRNPYFSQITLLYVSVSILGLLWVAEGFRRGEILWPRFGAEIPLALFLGWALFTLAISWVRHPTLRTGIGFEGLRVWIFTFANSVAALYFPFLFIRPLSETGRRLSIWTDFFFALGWSALWLGFHSMKDTDPLATMWDPYGAIVWGVGLTYAVMRVRRGEAREIIHLMMAVTVIAGLYAIFQYAGHDVIWSSPVTPYGGRPVSTFGNPNFLSSYLLLTTVLAAAIALGKEKSEAVGFGLVAVIGAAAVLSTLTRSTYVGLLAAFVCLGLLLGSAERKTFFKLIGLAALFVGLILIFPVTPVTKVQSPLARFTEIASALKAHESYGPWHQRLLIWSSAWDMVKEHPFTGKGWGCFELFYPYYQGAYLFNPVFAQWRTHANNAHNIVMEIWSQTGTVGLGFALLLFGSLVLSGRKILGRLTGEPRLLGAALLAGWMGMVVDNFFGNVSIFFAMPAFLFWWNMGTLLSALPPTSTVPSHRAASRAGAGLLGLLFLFSGVYYFSRWKQEVWYFQGFKETKSNLVPQSIHSLETAYAWFPGEVNSNYELGNSYARQAKTFSDQASKDEWRRLMEKAVWAYGRAIDANPGYDEIYFNRGVSSIQIGETDKGIRDLKTAVLINPLLENAYGPLSSLLANLKRWDEAKDILEQSVRAFPRNPEFWNNLGFIYGQKGEDEKSLEATKKAVELNPMFKMAWQNYKALVAKTKSKDEFARLPELMTRLSEDLNQKKFAEAKVSAEELVRLLPANADLALSYGNILFYLNDIDGALREYNRILKMAPTFEAAELNLGKVYRAKGDTFQARIHFSRAVELNGSDAEAKSALEALSPHK